MEMDNEYVGWWLHNLLVPGDPIELTIRTHRGSWELRRRDDFADVRELILNKGMSLNTYAISSIIEIGSGSRSAALDAAMDELLAVCLGASYLCGQAVSPTAALPSSSVMFVAVGDHYPRPRSIVTDLPACRREVEFVQCVEVFVGNFANLETTEKARLLIHHWLDSMACWSLEDLVLSTATMLEIIAATAQREADAAGIKLARNDFPHRINHAAARYKLPPSPADFRKMRNDLVHEGGLSRSKYSNKTRDDCARTASECLEWIDSYMHTTFQLKGPTHRRFTPDKFIGMNAFSVD
jgi:hypothetical protein